MEVKSALHFCLRTKFCLFVCMERGNGGSTNGIQERELEREKPETLSAQSPLIFSRLFFRCVSWRRVKVLVIVERTRGSLQYALVKLFEINLIRY